MDSIAQRFGQRLRNLRAMRGLTQPQLAELMGMQGPAAYHNILNWEKGSHLPNLLQIVELTSVLRVSANRLIPKKDVLP